MDGSLIGVVVSAGVAVVGPYLVYRSQKRSTTTDAAQKQIDQIQEDRESDRAEFAKASSRFTDRQGRLENRVETLEAMNRISSDYILQLRTHIGNGQPPPPPPFPPELTRGLPGDH